MLEDGLCECLLHSSAKHGFSDCRDKDSDSDTNYTVSTGNTFNPLSEWGRGQDAKNWDFMAMRWAELPVHKLEAKLMSGIRKLCFSHF